jgi:hypothetical protein
LRRFDSGGRFELAWHLPPELPFRQQRAMAKLPHSGESPFTYKSDASLFAPKTDRSFNNTVLREITEAEKVELETLGSRRYFFEDSREVEMDGRKLYRHRYYLVERDSTASAKIAAIIYSIPAESSQTKEAIEMRGLLRSRLRDSTFGADR